MHLTPLIDQNCVKMDAIIMKPVTIHKLVSAQILREYSNRHTQYASQGRYRSSQGQLDLNTGREMARETNLFVI